MQKEGLSTVGGCSFWNQKNIGLFVKHRIPYMIDVISTCYITTLENGNTTIGLHLKTGYVGDAV
jgi:hypothetical protein